MASPLEGKIKNKRLQSSSSFLQEQINDEDFSASHTAHANGGSAATIMSNQSQSYSQSSGPLDITRIQNSSAVNSQLNELLKKVNNQKEAVEKDVAEQHEKTKDFDLFQSRMSSMMKQSQQKEKEYEDQIHNNASKVSKYITKKAELQNKYLIQLNIINNYRCMMQIQAQRDLRENIKEINEQLSISKQQYDEQLNHKEDIFSKTLANKDKLLADLQNQLSKTQQQYEKARGLRISAEGDLKQKEEINIKMRDRIETQKRILNEKRKDPNKQALIEDLERQNEMRRQGLEDKMGLMSDNLNSLMNMKEKKEELEQKRLTMEHKRDDLQHDYEDKVYLEGRIQQVDKSVSELQDQKNKISNKINKKSDKVGGASQSSDELQQIVDMILRLTTFERTSQVLDDQLRDIENRLHILIEQNDFLSSNHLNNKDKLMHSLGKQKGSSSTGGLGFIIKHVMIEKKMDELKEELQRLRTLEEKQKKKLDEALKSIHSKNFEKVTKAELECVIIINEDVRKEVMHVIECVTEAEKNFTQIQTDFEKSQERMRLSYVTEVQERLKMEEDDNIDGIERTGKVIDSLRKFEQESEKQGKLMRSKEKKDEIKRLRDLAYTIRDDSNEIKANLNVRKNQIEKAKKNNKDVEKLSIGKLTIQLQELKGLDNMTEHDKKDVNDIERRVGDLSILFRDFLKTIVKEIFQDMGNKMEQRSKSLINLQKKDTYLLSQIEIRRNELFGISGQLEDDDLELQALYRKMEQTLEEANHNEDAASVFLRQLQSQTDRLQKQCARITKDNFNQEEVNELLDQLDGMDQVFQQCEDKLEEGIKRTTSLEISITEMELKIKIERIHECESEQRITSEAQEKLKRLLDRMQAQIFVIEKDQNYLLDEFSDMEKKKESLAFKQELDKKQREFGAFKVLRDKYKTQRDNQEQVYEEKQRMRDTIAAQEFQKMRKESIRLREDIQKVVENVHGAYGDEISACKEVIGKMVKKYKGKKDRYQACVEAKMTRESEIVVWKDRLLGMRDRIQMIEGQLSILGVNEEQEGVEIYKKFLGDIERLRQNAVAMDKSTQKFQERISDESEDLDQMEVKIVKTAKLEDIEKALDQIGMQIEGYEKEVEKFDLIQKQIEKEVEAFMNKIRSSQLFDCEQRISEVEDQINKLIKKLTEVGGEVTQFKSELNVAQGRDNSSNKSSFVSGDKNNDFKDQENGAKGSSTNIHGQSTGNPSNRMLSKNGAGSGTSGHSGAAQDTQPALLLNRDELTYKSEQFVDRVDQGGSQRTKISNQLEHLKSKLDGLDKKTVSMNEIYAILADAQTIGVQATTEIKKANDVQEELRQLNAEWKEKNKAQGERQIALQRAKDLIRSNAFMLQKMKVMLVSSNENVAQFDALYKSMLGSEDFNSKRGEVEKKMRRIAQLRSECGKYEDDKIQIEAADEKYTNMDLDSIQDVEKLQEIIKESEKIGNTLQHNVKELGDMGKGLEKKRIKVKDAEVRSLALKRKNELAVVADNLQEEMRKMADFENALIQRQLESTAEGETISPEKQTQIQRTLDSLRNEFSQFKSQYDRVEDEIRNVSTDIECRDLETENLSKLAKDVDRLKSQNQKVKELKQELDKIAIDLKSKRSLLSSMDTEKKLKDLLCDIEKEMATMDGSKQNISKVVDIAKNYEGYTSGNEDEEFFQVIAVEGQDLNQDLLGTNKIYSDLQAEIKKLIISVESKKAKSGGQLSAHEIEDLGDQILGIEGRYIRNKKTGSEICSNVEQSEEKVSHHGLENKIDRRGDELQELDKIINDILVDNQSVRDKIMAEIDLCKENALYEAYCKKFWTIITQVDNIDEMCKQVRIKQEDISSEQKKTRKRITLIRKERLEVFYMNLHLKKSIQQCLKQVGDIHSQVKSVFSKTNDCFGGKPKEVVPVQAYKFDPSDEVDKLFAFYLNKLGLSLPVKRLGGGYYMFGTKKIFCKIINGKLVVRVGGGYMGMEEFCNQYGASEQEKCKHQRELAVEAEEKLAQQDASSKNKDTSKKIMNALNLKTKIAMKDKNMDSPKTGRSEMSDQISMSGMSVTSAAGGGSTFLKQAVARSTFSQVSEEAKSKIKTKKEGDDQDDEDGYIISRGGTGQIQYQTTTNKAGAAMRSGSGKPGNDGEGGSYSSTNLIGGGVASGKNITAPIQYTYGMGEGEGGQVAMMAEGEEGGSYTTTKMEGAMKGVIKKGPTSISSVANSATSKGSTIQKIVKKNI